MSFCAQSSVCSAGPRLGWEKRDREGTYNASVAILQTLRWALAAALLATGCREQLTHRPPITCSLVVPEQGAYTGAYMDFGETEDDVTLKKLKLLRRLSENTKPSLHPRVTGENNLSRSQPKNHYPPQRHSPHLLVALGQTLYRGAWTQSIFPRRHRCRKMGRLYRLLGNPGKNLRTPDLCLLGTRNERHMVSLVGLFLWRRKGTLQRCLCRTRSL